jgi:alcohol dehydrogenase
VRGLSACAAAKDAGADFVMVTGVSPHDDERLTLAKEFGADLAVDVGSTDPARAVRQATGGGADVVVDVTAKAPAALAQAIAIAKAGGTIVMAGTRGSADTPGFWPDLIVYKELRILGALGVDPSEHRAAFDLLTSGRYPFADLPRRCASLDDAEALLRSMAGEGDGPPPVHGVVTP